MMYSGGSSIVMPLMPGRSRIIAVSERWSVVDLPEPVGPQMMLMPMVLRRILRMSAIWFCV
ncbi:hypothetical protein D3C71_1465880 [compost metagenome]